jgi:cytochrome bd-type quinol oxidase subunit 2
MDAAQVADAFGVMAVLAIAGAVLATVAAAVSADARATVRRLVDEHARVSVWLVAVIATAGSLWFSQSAGFTPCTLCWYQRIAVYPLVAVLGIRALRPGGSRDLRLAALLLVGAGLAVNVWHVVIETWPSLDRGSCSASVPCTLRWVEGVGFFTIPRLATVVFALVGLGLLLDRTDARRAGADDLDPYAGSPVPEEEHA